MKNMKQSLFNKGKEYKKIKIKITEFGVYNFGF